MSQGTEESLHREFRGLAKVIQRNEIPKDTPYEDPRAFGRRVAAEIFEQAVKKAENQASSQSETT